MKIFIHAYTRKGLQKLNRHAYNTFIFTATSKRLFNLSLFKKGVIFVNDSIDDSGNVKLWETLSAEKELNPTDFLAWYGILNAIPKELKMSVKNCGMCERDQHILYDTYCGFTVEKVFKHISCWKTTDIYDISVGAKFREPTSKESFTSKFNVSNKDWIKNYTLDGKVTIDQI